jgi:hypothetical protein
MSSSLASSLISSIFSACRPGMQTLFFEHLANNMVDIATLEAVVSIKGRIVLTRRTSRKSAELCSHVIWVGFGRGLAALLQVCNGLS